MNVSVSRRVFCIGSLVPTKAVLYWLILGTCEGSISHRFYDLKVRNCFKIPQCGAGHR